MMNEKEIRAKEETLRELYNLAFRFPTVDKVDCWRIQPLYDMGLELIQALREAQMELIDITGLLDELGAPQHSTDWKPLPSYDRIRILFLKKTLEDK